jgi:hypothetical protein
MQQLLILGTLCYNKLKIQLKFTPPYMYLHRILLKKSDENTNVLFYVLRDQ